MAPLSGPFFYVQILGEFKNASNVKIKEKGRQLNLHRTGTTTGFSGT